MDTKPVQLKTPAFRKNLSFSMSGLCDIYHITQKDSEITEKAFEHTKWSKDWLFNSGALIGRNLFVVVTTNPAGHAFDKIAVIAFTNELTGKVSYEFFDSEDNQIKSEIAKEYLKTLGINDEDFQ